MASPNFDEAAYRDGMTAFRQGVSLREVAERWARNANDRSSEAKEMSFALGFGDAFLAGLRLALSRLGA